MTTEGSPRIAAGEAGLGFRAGLDPGSDRSRNGRPSGFHSCLNSSPWRCWMLVPGLAFTPQLRQPSGQRTSVPRRRSGPDPGPPHRRHRPLGDRRGRPRERRRRPGDDGAGWARPGQRGRRGPRHARGGRRGGPRERRRGRAPAHAALPRDARRHDLRERPRHLVDAVAGHRRAARFLPGPRRQPRPGPPLPPRGRPSRSSPTVFSRAPCSAGGSTRSAATRGRRGSPVFPWSACPPGLRACGACAGLAAVLYTARLETGSPVLGQRIFLDVIGGAVIGGTSLFGGRGTVRGTAFGVLFISLVDNSLNLLGLSSFTVLKVKGGVILAAAVLDAWRERVAGRGAWLLPRKAARRSSSSERREGILRRAGAEGHLDLARRGPRPRPGRRERGRQVDAAQRPRRGARAGEGLMRLDGAPFAPASPSNATARGSPSCTRS